MARRALRRRLADRQAGNLVSNRWICRPFVADGQRPKRDGADEIELRLSPGAEDGWTTLELQHATTLGSHEIGGQRYDAIFCMGGGYYPRLLALDLHLCGALPDHYDSAVFHLNPNMRPAIERGSAAMAALFEAEAEG